MSNTKTLKLVMSALLAAMTCVATMVIKIPITTTGGYINLGDCIVLLSGILLGSLYGGLAADIGSALADLFSGYVAFLPATFLIKGFMAVIMGFGLGAAASIPGNTIQGVVGLILAMFLFPVFRTCSFPSLRKEP